MGARVTFVRGRMGVDACPDEAHPGTPSASTMLADLVQVPLVLRRRALLQHFLEAARDDAQGWPSCARAPLGLGREDVVDLDGRERRRNTASRSRSHAVRASEGVPPKSIPATTPPKGATTPSGIPDG